MKVSFESFLLDGGLKTLVSLKYFLEFETISLNEEPIKILVTNCPFVLRTSKEKFMAFKANSPVTIASRFLFHDVLTAISEITKSIL